MCLDIWLFKSINEIESGVNSKRLCTGMATAVRAISAACGICDRFTTSASRLISRLTVKSYGTRRLGGKGNY